MSSPQTSEIGTATSRTIPNVKDTSKRVARNMQDRAMSAIDSQREQATQRLGRVARAIRATPQDLDADDEIAAAELANRAAGGVDRVSDYLRDRDLNAVLHDAERVARDHPAICLGSAFLVGAIAGRILRASRRHDLAESLQTTPTQPLAAYRPQSEYAPSAASAYAAPARSSVGTPDAALRGGLEGAES